MKTENPFHLVEGPIGAEADMEGWPGGPEGAQGPRGFPGPRGLKVSDTAMIELLQQQRDMQDDLLSALKGVNLETLSPAEKAWVLERIADMKSFLQEYMDTIYEGTQRSFKFMDKLVEELKK